ncbi:hypothetical protein RGF97_09545 [Streptomyces roseicoloratus]|uniref:Peptidase M16 N-terminal domain-containing protein n=1 Tax=Streptomyces roseicoloratus TaxID=2508722 RepID=A0ABY9RVW6_9ACTN|nr:hypothetical protein [Streptomyces roseicoloratus]WMX45045.1 hypothetical protein RGF97_09545 [Streptomyces roseicoloratus]
MHSIEIDGVTVLWTEAPPPLEAALVFGCGVRDETFRTFGITHLVEHLAMSTLPRLHHDHNACVDLRTTDFLATGRPEQITAFLEAVCGALSDLPLERLDREAGVLAAEAGEPEHPTTGALLSRRYGLACAGLAPWRGPGADRLAPEAVREHVRRFFHADNAVLILSGPPPEGLRLPLPRGERPRREGVVPAVLGTGPAWSQECVPHVGLALHSERHDDVALSLAVDVLRERLVAKARHEHGLSYEVALDRCAIGAGHRERVVRVDARDGEEKHVAELLWTEALRLAADGPDAAELAEEVAAAKEALADPRHTVSDLLRLADAELFGEPTLDAQEWLDAASSVTPDQARRAFATSMSSALLAVPDGVEPALALPDGSPLPAGGCVRSRELPPGRIFRPGSLQRLISSAARRTHLVLGDNVIAMRDPDGDVHAIPFDEVVGVEAHGPGRVVFGRGGCVIPVLPDLFAKIAPAVQRLDTVVPRELHYPVSAYWVGEE